MKTATFIKETRKASGLFGGAALYKLNPPLAYTYWDGQDNEITDQTQYVVVSATKIPGYPETYIFPADEKGRWLDSGELEGSYRGGMDHEVALNNAGYEIREETA
jgi:hypothetical protein